MRVNKKQINKIKHELIAASLSVIVSFVALASSTYAWYVSNTETKATTSTVSAMANGMTLQIVAGTEPDHGKDNETIAFDSTDGHQISPSSTNDINTWYVPQAWTQGGIVSHYQVPTFSDVSKGEYTVAGEKFYAYVASTYTLYTVRDTGIADVYLDGSVEGGAIQVTLSDGSPIDDKIEKSIRVGIATQDRTTGKETLKVVYAPSEPTGAGNDAYSINNKLSGWITVKNTTDTMPSSYAHVFETTYIDQNSNNWAATKSGDNYLKPTQNPAAIATGVDYNGIIMKVYIWLEGTDADCINSSEEQINEDNLYNVTLYLVGTDAGSKE